MPNPSASSATSTFILSGVNDIDALLNEDHQKWSESANSMVALSYSFPWPEAYCERHRLQFPAGAESCSAFRID